MAHFAEIDQNNVVIRVLVTPNEEPDEGYQWLIHNLGGRWIKTSYNSQGGKHLISSTEMVEDEDGNMIERTIHVESGNPHLRYNFAGIGYTYDEQRDAFIPPMPPTTINIGEEIKEITWVLNEQTCRWEEVSE